MGKIQGEDLKQWVDKLVKTKQKKLQVLNKIFKASRKDPIMELLQLESDIDENYDKAIEVAHKCEEIAEQIYRLYKELTCELDCEEVIIRCGSILKRVWLRPCVIWHNQLIQGKRQFIYDNGTTDDIYLEELYDTLSSLTERIKVEHAKPL